MAQKYEYHRIKTRLVASGHSTKELAHYLNIAPSTLHHRLNGDNPWTLDEMYGILSYLEIPVYDVEAFFPNRKGNPLEIKLK